MRQFYKVEYKNWTLITSVLTIINSDTVETKSILFRYLEPGHTFMSADSFHHGVEMQLKKMGKVNDFDDFENCVKKASKKNVINMQTNHFYPWLPGWSF